MKPRPLTDSQVKALHILRCNAIAGTPWSRSGVRGNTLRSLRRRGFVRMRCVFREVSEWGAADRADRTYILPILTQWKITPAGVAALLSC